MGISRLIELRLIARVLIVYLGTTASGTAWAQMDGARKIEQRSITVSGTGKISVKPDSVEIQIGVISEAPTAKAALAANSESMNRIFQIVKDRGIPEKDVQTSNITVRPVYSQRPTPRPGEPEKEFIPKLIGYRIGNDVTVRARDIAKLGPLLDAVVDGGANEISGISFRVENSGKLMVEARKRAMADAKAKAQLFAGEAGVILGAPLTIDDISPDGFSGGGMGGRLGGRMDSSTPIAAGEQEITASVSVVYELKLP